MKVDPQQQRKAKERIKEYWKQLILNNKQQLLDYLTNDIDKMISESRSMEIKSKPVKYYKVKGISYIKCISKWRVRRTIGGKIRDLGYFNNINDAISSYKQSVCDQYPAYNIEFIDSPKYSNLDI